MYTVSCVPLKYCCSEVEHLCMHGGEGVCLVLFLAMNYYSKEVRTRGVTECTKNILKSCPLMSCTTLSYDY